MIRAGIDPQGILDVLDIFRGQEFITVGNIDPYVLTHPLSSTRFELMERRVAEAHARRRFETDPEMEYWHKRMLAKLEGFLLRPERVLDRYELAEETEFSLYAVAIALHRLPDPQAAIATIDRLIALRPNDPFYWELKGQILFESGQGEAAIQPYRRAVALAPEEPLIAAGLGRALLALGNPQADAEALRVLQEARRRDFANPSVLRDLATAYARAGDAGMAALATAERFAVAGDLASAEIHARRAVALLNEGSPGWLRATDILKLND